jgi:hypothetical protein
MIDNNPNQALDVPFLITASELQARKTKRRREGKIDGLAFVDQIAALANDRRSYFNSDRLPWSNRYPEQATRD